MAQPDFSSSQNNGSFCLPQSLLHNTWESVTKQRYFLTRICMLGSESSIPRGSTEYQKDHCQQCIFLKERQFIVFPTNFLPGTFRTEISPARNFFGRATFFLKKFQKRSLITGILHQMQVSL